MATTSIVDARVSVLWPTMAQRYEGVVVEWNAALSQHLVRYDDGDERWMDLRAFTYTVLLADVAAAVSSSSSSSRSASVPAVEATSSGEAAAAARDGRGYPRAEARTPLWAIGERVAILPTSAPDVAPASVERSVGVVQLWTCRNSWCTVLLDDGSTAKVRPRRMEALDGTRRWVEARLAKQPLTRRGPRGGGANSAKATQSATQWGSAASLPQSSAATGASSSGGGTFGTRRTRALEASRAKAPNRGKSRTKLAKLPIAVLLKLTPWRAYRTATLDRTHLALLSDCTEYHSSSRWPRPRDAAPPAKRRKKESGGGSGGGGAPYKKKSHKKKQTTARTRKPREERVRLPKGPPMPKKPATAYTMYVATRRSNRRADDPENFKAFAKKIGAEWTALDSAERSPYDDRAAANKQRWVEDMEHFRVAQEATRALATALAAIPDVAVAPSPEPKAPEAPVAVEAGAAAVVVAASVAPLVASAGAGSASSGGDWLGLSGTYSQILGGK